MLDSSLISPDASSRLSSSGLRLKTRMDIESSAPGVIPFARATQLQIRIDGLQQRGRPCSARHRSGSCASGC
jgi:hypothetical protein